LNRKKPLEIGGKGVMVSEQVMDGTGAMEDGKEYVRNVIVS
jgi:hypothetical protein